MFSTAAYVVAPGVCKLERMSNVAVYVRFRPENPKEARHGTSAVSPESADQHSFQFKDDNYGEATFSFDRVFYKDCSQADVYKVVALPIVEDAMNAINGTILAYGQTGAGKTYTVEGSNMLTDSAEMKGILPRVAQSIFEFVAAASATSEFVIKLAMVEIYKEKIRDLFDASKDNLQIKEDKVHGIFVAGATESWVQSEDEMVKLLEAGITNRAIGTTRILRSVFLLLISRLFGAATNSSISPRNTNISVLRT